MQISVPANEPLFWLQSTENIEVGRNPEIVRGTIDSLTWHLESQNSMLVVRIHRDNPQIPYAHVAIPAELYSGISKDCVEAYTKQRTVAFAGYLGTPQTHN